MVAEVYAVNVMPQDIAKFVGCFLSDKEKIGEVREDFLNFLQEREKDGKIYSDQILAWESYKDWQITFSSSDEFEHLDLEHEEVIDMSWSEELEKILDSKVNSIDYLANYDYDRQKGLPAQQ